jgi:hypothetical protein
MAKERIIAEVHTPLEAKKVEETVKTGYIEPLIETLVNWMGVEEDLAASYESLAAKPENSARKGVFEQLAKESTDNIGALSGLRKSLEDLDRARVRRIDLLDSTSP